MPHPIAASTAKTPAETTAEINAALARTAEAAGDDDW